MRNKLAAIFILFLPYFVVPAVHTVYDYNPNNFKQQIEELDGNFIMFYAPWCRFCTMFHPIWEELGELINTKDSNFAIAQVDCTLHSKLCHENEITGYPTLLYFHKQSFTPVEYKGTRDLPSLTLFLSEVFTLRTEKTDQKDSSDVKIYSGMAYLSDQNIEKFVSKGQHFVMFYAPWCKLSQRLASVWSELAVQYAHNEYIQIGKLNCFENEMTCKNFDIKQYPRFLWIVNGRIDHNSSNSLFTLTNVRVNKMGSTEVENLEDLRGYVEKMLQAENHDPEKFMTKKKALPVARISEETFETFLEKDLVFINYFAPWCAHCMQLNPLWIKLGEKFQNESRVLIADVDCVRSKQICEVEKINGLPTLILYKFKEIVNVEHGGRPLESLISLVTEHLQDSNEPPSVDAVASQEQSKVAKDEL